MDNQRTFKRVLAMLFLIILSLNLISSVEIHVISPQVGDVDESNIFPKVNNYCSVDWKCTPWGACIEGKRSRNCVDEHSCKFNYNYPITEITCRENSVKKVPNLENQFFVFGLFTIILLIIIFIILIGFM